MPEDAKSIIGDYLDKANAFYRFMAWGQDARPAEDIEDLPTADHFGATVTYVAVGMGDYGGAIAPKTPLGVIQPEPC